MDSLVGLGFSVGCGARRAARKVSRSRFSKGSGRKRFRI